MLLTLTNVGCIKVFVGLGGADGLLTEGLQQFFSLTRFEVAARPVNGASAVRVGYETDHSVQNTVLCVCGVDLEGDDVSIRLEVFIRNRTVSERRPAARQHQGVHVSHAGNDKCVSDVVRNVTASDVRIYQVLAVFPTPCQRHSALITGLIRGRCVG